MKLISFIREYCTELTALFLICAIVFLAVASAVEYFEMLALVLTGMAAVMLSCAAVVSLIGSFE